MVKILIIDDEQDIRLAVGSLLATQGYEVVEAADGKKGLVTLQKGGFDLIVLDFFMPGMNGRQVLEEIRKSRGKHKDVKVIVLTVATFGKEGFKKLQDLRINDYIQKPFVNKDLLARVKKLVG